MQRKPSEPEALSDVRSPFSPTSQPMVRVWVFLSCVSSMCYAASIRVSFCALVLCAHCILCVSHAQRVSTGR